MAQQFLNGPQIGAVFQQMGRESVPYGMGAHLLADGQLLHVFIEDAADASVRQAAAPVVDEDVCPMGTIRSLFPLPWSRTNRLPKSISPVLSPASSETRQPVA